MTAPVRLPAGPLERGDLVWLRAPGGGARLAVVYAAGPHGPRLLDTESLRTVAAPPVGILAGHQPARDPRRVYARLRERWTRARRRRGPKPAGRTVASAIAALEARLEIGRAA